MFARKNLDNQLLLCDIVNVWLGNLMFFKSGKNRYDVINTGGSKIGWCTGQTRYWYLRCYGRPTSNEFKL